MRIRAWFMPACVAVHLAVSPPAAPAGVTNPDISVIGQPFARVTDDPAVAGGKHPALDPGEAEVMADAYLNPYAKGTFVFSFGHDGAAVEEAYFTMLRGLPGGLALKGGQYRAGFGKLNPQHPHAWPFADRPHVLADYLPGTESFNETGLQLSEQFALPHDVALTASADWLQGNSFRIARPGATADTSLGAGAAIDRANEPRPAGLARLSAFIPAGDRSGIELGASLAHGTNNVAAASHTTLLGADLKAKLWRSANSYVVLQGEWLALRREDAGWNPASSAFTSSTRRPSGGYFYADWNFSPRYSAGLAWERYQAAEAGGPWNQGVRAFAGLALMEETTVFRIDAERFLPGAPAGAPAPTAVHAVTLRVIYSMGPHKAHQF